MATLRRVVVENYKIFYEKQELDFRHEPSLSTGSKYFTLVGENGSGKSTFLALVGLASDFGGKVTSHTCNQSKMSIVACEYKVSNWSDLTSTSQIQCETFPALQLWFLNGVLKIPHHLYDYLLERYLGVKKEELIVVIGFRRTFSFNTHEEKKEENVFKFLYVQTGSSIVALVHGLHSEAKIAVTEILGEEDLLHWCPDESIFISTGCNFLRDMKKPRHPFDGFNPKRQQASLILALRNTLPVGERDTIWADTIELFHELTGNPKITVVYDSHSDVIHMRQQYGGCDTIRDDLPEGFFHALLIAFLISRPAVKTILLDEPTRGMHPLQIRRLRRILSQKSLQEDKVIIVASHAPDMVHTSEINQIFRYQQLDSGFVNIRQTSRFHDNRDLRFISAVESRELFFTRRVIWVEGNTDQRFCEAMLKLIDMGNEILWSKLVDPQDLRLEYKEILVTESDDTTMDEVDEDTSDEVDYGPVTINPLQNLFQSSAYERKYFSKEVLANCQELVRSCSVLPLSGKKNIDKATKICKDLGIPYAVICDLDAVLPNSKKNSIMSQFLNCVGNWSLARIDKKLLFDCDQSPASMCLDSPDAKAELRNCRHALEIMEFYEQRERIFAWRVGNGEIEDLVKVTKPSFSKKRWPDFIPEDFQDLILELISLSSNQHLSANLGYSIPFNPEILRCFMFIIKFLQENH